MRASSALVSVFSAAMMFNAVLCDRTHVYVRSCDELPPGELDVVGTITFLRDISCQEPRVMHINDDLFLRSHAALDTKNIHFKVHKGATMTLHSPGMTIARDQGSTVPIFDVSGKVTFEATGSIPGIMSGNLDDERGVIYMAYSGTVETSEEIRYGDDSVTVSKMPKPGEELGVSGWQAVELSPALKVSQAAYHAKIQAHADGASSSSSSSSFTSSTSSSTPSSSSSSATPSSLASSDNNGESDASFLSGYFNTPGAPGVRHSAQFNNAPIDTAATNGQEETARHTTANADHHEGTADGESPGDSPVASPAVMPTPSSDHTSTANAYGDGPRHRASDSPSASTTPPSPSSSDSPSPSHGHSHSHSYGDSTNPTSTPGSPSNPGNQQRDSDNDRPGSRGNSPRVVSGPKLALKVGELREPPFLSGSGKSIMWPAEDGSVMFRRIFEGSTDVITGSEGTREKVTTVMVPPDAGRLKRVFKARMALRKEMREGNVSASSKGTWGAWGWVPWGRQHRQDVDRAREHLGEVAMTIDDRACLEVTVDGICVLSKSGPYKREWRNRFPWRRRKDNAYELFVTEEGMEVQLGEKTIWGVTAADMMD